MIIQQTTDIAGKIRILWQSQATSNIYEYKFKSEPSLDHLNELSNASDTRAELAAIVPLGEDFSENRDAIWAFVEKVRSLPTMTLTNYNSFLGTILWNEAAGVRNFVFIVAKRLSERQDIEVSAWTEGTVVREVRDFILQTSDAHLERLIFG